ncbi:MAG: polysaccharide biosynthesis tyrosine autokinase, partial [Anaerolineales bacterium]
LDKLPFYLVSALPNSQLIEISVSDTDPLRAKSVADELAKQLIERAPTNLNEEDRNRAGFIDDQLTQLQDDIESTQDEIAALKIQLGGLQGAREIADLERQIAALDDKLRTLQSSYANLLSSTQQGAVNTLTVIEPAEVPSRPRGTNRVLTVLVAMLLGGAVASAGAYLIEFVDSRVASEAEVTQLVGWPVLARLEELPESTDPPLVMLNQPRSLAANSFRLLKTNLELVGAGAVVRSILVTGPAAGEGKSTVALNLALAFAASGRKVILIDGDTYRPDLAFANQKGLSDLLLDGGEASKMLVSPYGDNLSILPAGPNPTKARGLLDTPKFEQLLSNLNAAADIVIVDGPPAFVSDSLVLASRVDGVISVVRLGHSERTALQDMKRQYRASGIHILGAVINNAQHAPVYYGNYYDLAPLRSAPEKERGIIQWFGALLGKLRADEPIRWPAWTSRLAGRLWRRSSVGSPGQEQSDVSE